MMNEGTNQRSCRVFLVTGAAGEIGSAISRRLAQQPEHEVVLVGRGETRLEQLAEQIMRSTGNPLVRYEVVDLSRKAEVEALAERWQGPLHVLINNAAITPRKREETPEGIELQFATNVLGYFWMTKSFEEILKQTARSSAPQDAPRVVNVASYWSGDLDMSDLEFKHRSYHNGIAYRQSKQANIMLTTAFAWRMSPYGITVNVCHPGDVRSKVSTGLGFGGSQTADESADTPVWLAVSKDVRNVTGKYFENRSMVRNPFLEDRAAAERLYQICEGY
mgnify:CR=1 FL=1